MENINQHTISLYVSNKPGVLIRIALVFARRGYNIDSLVVSESSNSKFSRMTITASGNSLTLELMLEQLNKVIDVVNAKDMTNEDVINKELAFIKINVKPEERAEILSVVQAFKGEVIDIASNALSFQVSGDSSKMEAIKKIVEPYGLIEMIRSGKILISRGSSIT